MNNEFSEGRNADRLRTVKGTMKETTTVLILSLTEFTNPFLFAYMSTFTIATLQYESGVCMDSSPTPGPDFQ